MSETKEAKEFRLKLGVVNVGDVIVTLYASYTPDGGTIVWGEQAGSHKGVVKQVMPGDCGTVYVCEPFEPTGTETVKLRYTIYHNQIARIL